MERAKKARTPVRASVTKSVNALETELGKEDVDQVEVETALKLLQQNMDKLTILDEQIVDLMLDSEDFNEADIEVEANAIEEYVSKVTRIQIKASKVICPSIPSPSFQTASDVTQKRNFKLPKIELKKFSGELTEWLGWWAQFQKIDEDLELHDSDKFQYLFQSMEVGTRAHELVSSYPQSKENYPKVIQALKERFGNPKLLKQVYVRELIKMIMVTKIKGKLPLSSLYDKLESHLRSLESLGVTVQQTVEFLYPMVESSLPEDILLAWQRSANYGKDGSKEDPPKSELNYLMEFLKLEIENEEQRKMARAGFGAAGEKKSSHNKKELYSEEENSTAAGLFSGSGKKTQCIFCDKSHESRDCFKAQNMSMDEKKAIVSSKKVCFICLKAGHRSKQCKASVKCIICGSRHLTLFCAQLSSKSPKVQKENPTSVPTSQVNLSCTSEVVLQTVMVKLWNTSNQRSRTVRVLLDCAAQRSYIKKSTVRALGLISDGSTIFNHSLFGGNDVMRKNHNIYEAEVSSICEKFRTTLKLYDEEIICGTIPRVRKGQWMTDLKEKKILINDLDPKYPLEVEVLIGADNLGSILTGKCVKLNNGLVATETKFGWTLMGSLGTSNSSLAMTVLNMSILSSSISNLWSLEVIGVRDPIEVKTQEEKNLAAKKYFVETVARSPDGRYSVSLPWINKTKSIPNNRDVAVRRLSSATNKLISTGMFENYDNIFKAWEEEEIITVVSEENISGCHYLPHRAVIKPESKTTPVRPVFDASCKVGRAPSLNECMEKGPNLLELIPSILLRFRMDNIGIVADIRKAFLMIEVNEAERDFLRFIWWENYEEKKLQVYRHNRVVFGMNCSPFLLGAVIEHHLDSVKNEDKIVAEQLKNSLYVDNLVTSVRNQEEVFKFMTTATKIMADAKMELRQWECTGDENGDIITNVLGMKWNKSEDSLFCSALTNEIPEKFTKRVILSQLHRIFDPLGFLSPVLLIPKLLLQRTWIENKNWDADVGIQIKEEFLSWWSDLFQVMGTLKFPRNCNGGVNEEDKFQLHTFCDASKLAYAAVVYLRVEKAGVVSVQLLQSKTRVAPVKPATIPRLELLSCLIASRLTVSIVKALKLENVPQHFWTDSSTALAWIKKSDDWGTFVGNRVREICQLTNSEDWKHVPGVLNPADLPSRGINPSKFLESNWWEGPQWLKFNSDSWPVQNFIIDYDLVDCEKKKTVAVMSNQTADNPWYLFGSSSYSKILRIMTLVLRFISKLGFKFNGFEATVGNPSKGELDVAEIKLMKIIQRECFSKTDNVISGLKVVRDANGVIRVKTKLLNRQDTEDFKSPVLLPNSHPLVELMIREEHIFNCHGGVQFLLSFIREKFWIIQGRKAVRKVIGSCVKCRRFNAKRSAVPVSALPENRVKDAQAFEITGIDLAGPLLLRNGIKCWIVLFTCAVYRCVHMELVLSLTTEDFLLSFTRFCSRFRRPAIVYSDNGTNFVGAVNLFKNINWKEVEYQTQQFRIKWIFNPPAAPWWGGWWERLIRCVKDLLRKMLGFRKMSYAELETCICEVESAVNHRPLTYVTEDQDDLIPLTPAMFIYDLPFTGCPESSVVSVNFGSKRKNLQQLLEQLKERFRKEYLSQLVQRGKDQKYFKFKVGDIVLVETENKKRIFWPMAKIVKLIEGADGEVRVAQLKTRYGELTRPLQRLFPLEVSYDDKFYAIPDSDKEVEEIAVTTGTGIKEIRTKSGRLVKLPQRFGN